MITKGVFANCVIEADLIWLDGEFKRNHQIIVGNDNKITEVKEKSSNDSASDKRPLFHFKSKAILPGFINTHSHAFHRGLRTFTPPLGERKENFWGWRDSMFSLVTSLSIPEFKHVCRMAFEDMMRSGITTVGEFHYWHHPQPKKDTNTPFEMDRVILDAADEAGIRIVLLNALYERPGISETEKFHPAQLHFLSSLDEYWLNLDNLSESIRNKRKQSLGVVAHSIRAVYPENIEKLVKGARERNYPVHMHLEEQPKEISDCKAAYRDSPIGLNLPHMDASFTAVHCTHTTAEHMEELSRKGVNVSICPLTEGRLGDGIIKPPDSLNPEQTFFSFGTDCNFRIDFTEELRTFLYDQQKIRNARGLGFGVTSRALFCVNNLQICTEIVFVKVDTHCPYTRTSTRE